VKYLLIGLATLLLCAVFFAPASLIKNGLESSTEIAVTDTRGSLWNGSAMLSMPGIPEKTQTFELGRLNWKFVPQALFSLCLTYQVELRAQTHTFSGRICRSKDSLLIEGDLKLHSSLLNSLLIDYDMQVTGLLEMTALRLEMDLTPNSATLLHAIKDLSAQMHWPGGPIQYRLSGLNHELSLPAMQGELGYENRSPNMRVFEQNENSVTSGQKPPTPLILGNLDQNGWISIGITKKFTELLNQPWPGSEPDHAVVLEVQEKLL